MATNLVIVESPAKARTISKYLGNEYIVKSSVGHIRDLPKGKSRAAAKRAGIPKDISEEEKIKSDDDFIEIETKNKNNLSDDKNQK